MFLQENSLPVAGILIGLGVVIIIGIIVYLQKLVVVPFNEVHVISQGKKTRTYDGKGRYFFLKVIMGRTIIPKHILDIEPAMIKLHDRDNLPYGVSISVKVQVTDPQQAAASLTRIDHSTVAKVVEDTVMSAARSIAMERTILDVMKKREEVEQAVYDMVADALSKLGLSAVIFDIKDIQDYKGSNVIASLERVKVAELHKEARISEAQQNSLAEVTESEEQKKSKVKQEEMQQQEEAARLIREEEVARRQAAVENERLALAEQKETRMAEIAREKARIEAEARKEQKLINAQADADAIMARAESEAEAIRIKAQAEAESIQKRGEAEAEVLKKKNAAMGGDFAGQIELMKLFSVTQVDSAAKIAEALGQNNKIMYLPTGENSNLLSNFLPNMNALMESGLPQEIIDLLKKGKKASK